MPPPRRYKQNKLLVIASMGLLMVLYSVAEIGFSLYFNSLIIFSDGLHNLSDGVALAGLACGSGASSRTDYPAHSLVLG